MRPAAETLLPPLGAIPQVAGTPDRGRARFSPVVWLNLVCLDAPIVAVTWQWFFGQCFHLRVEWPARVALFLTAWIIYLADRLGDALRVDQDEEMSWRERFCYRHRNAWWCGLAVVALLDGWTVATYLNRALLPFGVALALASATYLAINYWLGKWWRRLPLKEFCIGLLFAAGTAFSLRPVADGPLLAAFLLFALLCILNCVCIAVWELELDLAQGKDSIATCWPHLGERLRFFTRALAVVSLCVALLRWTSPVLAGAVGTSALLLGGLDLAQRLWRRDERTALADLVLLTPLVFYLWAL